MRATLLLPLLLIGLTAATGCRHVPLGAAPSEVDLRNDGDDATQKRLFDEYRLSHVGGGVVERQHVRRDDGKIPQGALYDVEGREYVAGAPEALAMLNDNGLVWMHAFVSGWGGAVILMASFLLGVVPLIPAAIALIVTQYALSWALEGTYRAVVNEFNNELDARIRRATRSHERSVPPPSPLPATEAPAPPPPTSVTPPDAEPGPEPG